MSSSEFLTETFPWRYGFQGFHMTACLTKRTVFPFWYMSSPSEQSCTTGTEVCLCVCLCPVSKNSGWMRVHMFKLCSGYKWAVNSWIRSRIRHLLRAKWCVMGSWKHPYLTLIRSSLSSDHTLQHYAGHSLIRHPQLVIHIWLTGWLPLLASKGSLQFRKQIASANKFSDKIS